MTLRVRSSLHLLGQTISLQVGPSPTERRDTGVELWFASALSVDRAVTFGGDILV